MKRIALAALLATSLGAFSLAHADSGSATSNLTLIVPVATSVSCVSPTITGSTVGLQTMSVNCTITGNPNNFAAGTANSFTPASPVMTSGANTLTAARQTAVTSSNSSVTGFVGNSAGFTATLGNPVTFSNTWLVSTTYTTTTTASTPSGTYVSTPITYAWSFI